MNDADAALLCDGYPERGWVSFLDGEIWVDTDMEQLFSHNRVKTCFTIVLGGLAEAIQRVPGPS